MKRFSNQITFRLKTSQVMCLLYSTVDENIIATIKVRNNFCYPLKMVIFRILRQQYWSFLYCSLFSYRSSNFPIAKIVTLNLNFCMSFVLWFMASFLYCFPYSYRSSNYCDSNSYRSFTLLKALAKSNDNLFAIAFKSEKERQLSLSRQLEER